MRKSRISYRQFIKSWWTIHDDLMKRSRWLNCVLSGVLARLCAVVRSLFMFRKSDEFGINILDKLRFALVSGLFELKSANSFCSGELTAADLLKNEFWMDNEFRLLFGELFAIAVCSRPPPLPPPNEYRPLEPNVEFVKLFRFAVLRLFAFRSVVIPFNDAPFKLVCNRFAIVEQCWNWSAAWFVGFIILFNEFVVIVFLELFNEFDGLSVWLSGLLCCVSLCLRRSTFLWNARQQISQANGL